MNEPLTDHPSIQVDDYPEFARSITICEMHKAPVFTPALDVRVLIYLARFTRGDIAEIGCNRGLTSLQFSLHFPSKTIWAIDRSSIPPGNNHQSAERTSYHELGVYCRNQRNVNIVDGPADYGRMTNVSMVFIDADHTYAGVKADTEQALEHLRNYPSSGPKWIVWHDYTPDWMRASHPAWVGVGDYVRAEIAPHYKVIYVRETTLAYAMIP